MTLREQSPPLLGGPVTRPPSYDYHTDTDSPSSLSHVDNLKEIRLSGTPVPGGLRRVLEVTHRVEYRKIPTSVYNLTPSPVTSQRPLGQNPFRFLRPLTRMWTPRDDSRSVEDCPDRKERASVSTYPGVLVSLGHQKVNKEPQGGPLWIIPALNSQTSGFWTTDGTDATLTVKVRATA